MSYVQSGRAQRGGMSGVIIVAIVAIVAIAAAYFVFAGSYGGNAPSNPYPSLVPSSVPKVTNYP